MKEKMRIVCFQIDNILEKHLTQPVLVAIDGMSASGKSTLGNLLKEK